MGEMTCDGQRGAHASATPMPAFHSAAVRNVSHYQFDAAKRRIGF